MTARPGPDRIEAAGECLALALLTLYGVDGTSVEDAAKAAWTPTGPTLEELQTRITALRAQATTREESA